MRSAVTHVQVLNPQVQHAPVVIDADEPVYDRMQQSETLLAVTGVLPWDLRS